jgi:hypothetical protein
MNFVTEEAEGSFPGYFKAGCDLVSCGALGVAAIAVTIAFENETTTDISYSTLGPKPPMESGRKSAAKPPQNPPAVGLAS